MSFLLISRKSTKKKLQQWPGWQNPWVSNLKFILFFFNLKLFFSLGFKWKTTKSCKKKSFSLWLSVSLIHSCDHQGLFRIYYIVLMLQYALLEIHLVWGWTLCWNCYPKYGVLFGGLCWGLGPTIIPIWILRGLVKVGSSFMCRYSIGG